jgi:energy-coupling factor transporter ATP-binding protein EcfA2
MSKLTKLSIKKFRNVAPTTLEFSPGLNVLLGRNAAGKTTLLRLLSTAIGSRDEALQDDVLDMSCRVSSASLGFEYAITKKRVDESLRTLNPELLVGREEFSSLLQTGSFLLEKNGEFVMKAEVLSNEVVLERVGQQRLVEKRYGADPTNSLFFALMEHAIDLWQVISTVLTGSAGRMDESLEGLGTLLKCEAKIVRAGSRLRWEGVDIPRWVFKMLSKIPEGTSVTFSPVFLERAARMLGYESANARFDVERLSPAPGQSIARLSNLRFFFKRPGEEISHDLLSYGQKRLLAFFAHADASRDVIIADELVNGLHHEWISACLHEIGDRQAFLTSQNPLLLDFLRFESAEEVRRTFILCERASSEAGAQLVWRNPTEEEAESFFSAYQTGIQRVSDILLTKGLW